MDHSSTISLYQPVLYRIALNIVGSVRDAEDLVQDTFLRWLSVGPATIRNTEAYLVKSIYNNSFSFLKRSKVNDTLDEVEDVPETEEISIEPSSLSSAFHILQEHLKPLERAMLVLRESFNFEYEELQTLFGQKQEYCRQLVSRAKKKIEEIEIKKSFNLNTTHLKTQSLFENATNFGHISDLTEHFMEEIGKYLKK